MRHPLGMSTSTHEHGDIPALTLGWRLKMALGHHKAEWMADQLGVSRQTLSRWMADKGSPPTRAYVRQWALVTGVDQQWLETGETPARPEPDGGLKVVRARRYSKPQPSDPKVGVSAKRAA